MVLIDLDRKSIRAFCERPHIRKLSFFGVVLCRDFARGGDVDVHVEFEDGNTSDLVFLAMERVLSALLGRKVDLNTPGFLSRLSRATVFLEAEQVYVAA